MSIVTLHTNKILITKGINYDYDKLTDWGKTGTRTCSLIEHEFGFQA